MQITRKQALVALVAGAVPWIARRAYAQGPGPVPQASVRAPAEAAPTTQTQLDELKSRVAALEAQLAKQVAFSTDERGNLTLVAPGHLTLESKGAIDLRATATLTIKGSMINLN